MINLLSEKHTLTLLIQVLFGVHLNIHISTIYVRVSRHVCFGASYARDEFEAREIQGRIQRSSPLRKLQRIHPHCPHPHRYLDLHLWIAFIWLFYSIWVLNVLGWSNKLAKPDTKGKENSNGDKRGKTHLVYSVLLMPVLYLPALI